MLSSAAISPGSRDLLPVFNALPGAFLLLTPEAVIEAASDEYLAATLTTREQLVGRLIFDAFPDNPAAPEAHATQNLRASLAQVLATGQPHQMALQHYDVLDPEQAGNFVERHWLCTNRPVRDADGHLTYLLHAAVDVTEQRRTDLLLRETQAAEQAARAEVDRQRVELVHLFEQAPVALAVFQGPHYVVELANPHVLRLWGRSQEQALHTPLFELLPEIRDQGFKELLDEVLTTGVPHVAHEMPSFIDRDGRRDTVYWNFVYQPLRQEDGRVTGVTVVATEVSEQVRARQQAQQLNQELEAHVRARTQEAEDARQEAEQARQRLAQAFHQAPFYINLYRGAKHVFELVHPFTQDLFGNRVLLGRPRREALPELPEESHRPFDQAYTTGQPQHQVELRTTIDRAGDGQLREVYFDVVYQPLVDAAGRVEGILTLSTDVTERVRTRQQAEALQARLYHVFEQTPAQVALLRAPGHRFEYVNPAYQALFPQRLIGREVADVAPELVVQGFKAQLDHVYQTGETFFGTEVPFTLVSGNGQPTRTLYFNFTYQAYREDDQIAGVSVFAFDVTEQVRGRQQREAERQQLHHLFMEAPAPIVILDGPDLVYQLVNPAYQRIFPGRVLLGKPLLEALPELTTAPLLQDLQRAYETGETFVAQELPLLLARHEGGPLEEIYWTFTYQARRNAQGAVDGVLVFAHEVTDQVQARRVVEEGGQQARALAGQLAEANEQLTRTNVDLDNFIYTASHDLRVPIINIEGLLLAFARELPPAARVGDVPTMLQLMQDSVNRFKRTIAHLTDVSKLQQAHGQPLTEVPLAAVVEEVQLDLLPLVEQTQAHLTIDVPAQALVPFSEKNLRSVVYNLLSNALKYHHPDRPPRVQLAYYRHEPYHVLRVQDNGLGFDVAKTKSKLFGMFQRLHTHVEGSGIGLYMVKKIVENSGGRIEVQSQPGEGTTFTVFFPVHPMS